MLTGHQPETKRRHILTVALEDYFHGAAFHRVLTPVHWSRLEQRIHQNTERTLSLLDDLDSKATFFVSSPLASQIPGLLRQIIAKGHEVASAGVTKQSFRHLNRAQLTEEAADSKTIIEQITGQRVLGYRVADRRLSSKDLWGLEVLAEQGYAYDSSLSPTFRSFSDQPYRRTVHEQSFASGTFHEVPLSSANLAGFALPIAGGNYFRQLPETWLTPAIKSWLKSNDSPFVFYFRVWDLDSEQPEITGAPLLARVRHYRNAQRMPDLLRKVFDGLRLVGVADYLELDKKKQFDEAIERSHITVSSLPQTKTLLPMLAGEEERKLTAATVVIPCFNEADSITYLSKSLQQLSVAARERYALSFVIVDDASTDATWDMLHASFADWAEVRLIRHERNQGVMGAILTGLRAATTDLVCSIDCDCTYDPVILLEMLPLATEGVSCVTASPYHPEGYVENVPAWRLAISASGSILYRLVLQANLYTFTSCCRIYRRIDILKLDLRESGFVGVAELLGVLHLQGGVIREYPATLSSRLLGQSKMKIARTIMLHLRLVARLSLSRLQSRRAILVNATGNGVIER